MTDQDKIQQWARDADRMAQSPSELIPAATVIVIRDAPTRTGIETLMLRRNSKLEFAGGMWVFPGGRVDPTDHGLPGSSGAGDVELAPFRAAAIREAKEEADLDLDLVAHELVTFSYWEPPPITPKRFATWFFLAPSPSGTAADITIDDGEITDHTWMDPDEAIERRDALEIELAPPTWVTLHTLRQSRSVAEAIAAARVATVERYSTKVSLADRKVTALWHGDAGYEASDAEVPGPRHRLAMLDEGWVYEREGC